MRSIFGECSGKVRSTPTPNDCFRTVKVSRTPLPWRLMTMPSKTWVRLRFPSTTWKCTRTRSPAPNLGRCFRSRFSRLSMTVPIRRMIGWELKKSTSPGARAATRKVSGEALLRPLLRLLQPPLLHAGVIAREQDVGDLPAAIGRGAGVVRVLGGSQIGRAVGLLDRALGVAERAGQLAQHRIGDHHRGQLAAREHVTADRNRLVREVLHHPLIEALVASA